MTQRLKLYIDMDGVLVDFVKGYEKASGRKCEGPDDAVFWQPVLDTLDFWVHLEWMPGGKELWDYVRQHHYVTLLSSPGTHDRARAMVQKRRWVWMNLGHDVNIVFKNSKEKHHYAADHCVLVDDWKQNIASWRDSGGIAIKHENTEQTIRELRELGLDYRLDDAAERSVG